VARQEPTLEQAKIRRQYISYHVIANNWPLLVMIITIPILLISVPISLWVYKRRYERLLVTLHPKTLKIRQGILVVHEKTIPLNKITDLAIFHGPIMRMLGLKGLRVETAGQTGTGGALATVIGIEDTDDFRDAVLDQRDKITDNQGPGPASVAQTAQTAQTAPSATGADTLLQDIRDTLMRIEKRL
jgi:putative membrane protein